VDYERMPKGVVVELPRGPLKLRIEVGMYEESEIYCLGAKRRTKPPLGHHSKPNVWDKAAALSVRRIDPLGGESVLIDPGVNYFVLMLNQLGYRTFFSCEGHPEDFYISFEAPYQGMFPIADAGYFSVELSPPKWHYGRGDNWNIRLHIREIPRGSSPEKSKVDRLRGAASSWEETLGPLDFDSILLEDPSGSA
jgi:hypothetical protein